MKSGKERERKVRVGALKWRTGERKEETGGESRGIKFEASAACVCFCAVMNQGN